MKVQRHKKRNEIAKFGRFLLCALSLSLLAQASEDKFFWRAWLAPFLPTVSVSYGRRHDLGQVFVAKLKWEFDEVVSQIKREEQYLPFFAATNDES